MNRYGLIGRTLKHSFSKTYFTKKFEEECLTDYAYDNFEIESINDLPALVNSHPDLKGLNITIPYKEEVLPFLTEKDKVVEEIGACNCLKIEGDKVIGYNTDAVGFQKSLQPLLQPHHTKALILGTGGASKAIAYVLKQLSIDYYFVSRHRTETVLGYVDVGEKMLASRHLIINTTPLGMWPNIDEDPAIPYAFITPEHLLFDIIYNPAKTKFLAKGEAKGAQIANGYQMLIDQAEESWRIWNKK